MSGRISSNRLGYADFDCEGLMPIDISCPDCDDDNRYNNVPTRYPGIAPFAPYLEGLAYGAKLLDPVDVHLCDYKYEPINWLPPSCSWTPIDSPEIPPIIEVNPPDIPPVSVRSLDITKEIDLPDFDWIDPPINCSLCYEGKIKSLYVRKDDGSTKIHEWREDTGTPFSDTNSEGKIRIIPRTLPASPLHMDYTIECYKQLGCADHGDCPDDIGYDPKGFKHTRDFIDFSYCPVYSEEKIYSIGCSGSGKPMDRILDGNIVIDIGSF